MIVQFNDLTKFVAELDAEPQAVARQRVRIDRAYRRTNVGITHLHVVATAKVLSIAACSGADDYDVVRYEQHVGDLWGHPQDDAVKEAADSIVASIESEIAAGGFVVAAGFYVPGAS